MKRLGMLVLGVILGGALFYFYSVRVHADEADPLQDYGTWAPNAAAVHTAVAQVPKSDNTAADEKARELTFEKLLTGRFRNHDPSMAIRVHFHSDNLVYLMCPARMEPWNMDRLATTVWREAKDDLGRNCDVDIFITFIGTAPVKVGELRVAPGTPEKVCIRYNAPAAGEPLISRYVSTQKRE